MKEKDEERRDLESGDNPQERKRQSGKKESDLKNKEDWDLESGDNPAERGKGQKK